MGRLFRIIDIDLITEQYIYIRNRILLKISFLCGYFSQNSYFFRCFYVVFTDAWEQRKVSDLSTGILSAARVHKDEWTETGVPFWRSSDVMSAYNGTENEKAFISVELYTSLIKKSGRLEKGDLLITGGGSIGIPYVVPSENPIYTKDADLLWVKKTNKFDSWFLYYFLLCPAFRKYLKGISHIGTIAHYTIEQLKVTPVMLPCIEEQEKIGDVFSKISDLITLHLRKSFCLYGRINMIMNASRDDSFCAYYEMWINMYKLGAIRKVTMGKYLMALSWLRKLAPDLKVCDLSRIAYQQILNEYAETHERQTTMDFHHQLKGAILDAVEEGLLDRDPTRKVIIKGKAPRAKKIKYLNQFELQSLLSVLRLGDEINWDWFIYLVAKTGMRFSEALALTPADFDFNHQTVSVDKTWDYKGEGGYLPTKNKSSVRKIPLDWQTVIRFAALLKDKVADVPIFVHGRTYNSTVNAVLGRRCKEAKISSITVHGLRHTHASLLLFSGVSIASVARRLGHASMTTTQKTYLHVIQELENKDVDLIMRSLSSLS